MREGAYGIDLGSRFGREGAGEGAEGDWVREECARGYSEQSREQHGELQARDDFTFSFLPISLE